MDGAPSEGSLSVSTAPRVGPLASSDDGGVDFDAGATAHLACVKWLRRHNTLAAKCGAPAADLFPVAASYKFGNDPSGQVESPEGVPVAIPGRRGKLTTFAVDADISAPPCTGASGAMEGMSDFSRNWALAYRPV